MCVCVCVCGLISDFKCPSLPQPVNGHMSCLSHHAAAAAAAADDDDDDGGGGNSTYSCRLECDDGYVPFNGAPAADVIAHVCSPLTNHTWLPPFSDDEGHYLCLSQSSTHSHINTSTSLCLSVCLSVCLSCLSRANPKHRHFLFVYLNETYILLCMKLVMTIYL